MKPIGLFKRGGRVPKSFFLEKPNETMPFFRSAFHSTLLKHAGEVFFVLGNADFFKFKNASKLTLGKPFGFAHKSFTQRANIASWLISHIDYAYCYRLYGLSPFSNRPTVLRKL